MKFEIHNIFSIRILVLLILFLAGAAYWIHYFHDGNLSLVAYDWKKESTYLTTLRDALQTRTVPWYWGEAYYHGTNKFLANPETVLTPDILLLPWISNGTFILMHTLFLYILGFIGTVILMKKIHVGTIPFIYFWMLFNFNGYLGSHLSIGHFQWTGYFLLPFFFILLDRFLLKSEKSLFDLKSSLVMGLLLGFLILNGSVHIAIWCSMFMLITILWKRKIYVNVIASIIIGVSLGISRLLPAAIWFPKKHGFISGYPSFETLLSAFTTLREHNYMKIGSIFGKLGWWEYDIYIGFVAFIIMIITVIYTIKHEKIEKYMPFLATSCILIILSLGNVYALIGNSSIPFSSVERVPSRFIIMPFILFLIFSVLGINRMMYSKSIEKKIPFMIAIPFIAYELYLHSLKWDIRSLESCFPNVQLPIPTLKIMENQDTIYHLVVTLSWITSLIVLALVINKLLPFKNYTRQ